MNETVLPELKQIIGAMLFVRKEPLSLAEMRRVLSVTAERRGGITSDFAKATEELLKEALSELGRDLAAKKVGFHLAEVAGGYRLENDAAIGPWLRVMLQKGRGARLSLPALETLAIIAYRQPCVRSEIEAVRGVAVDAILRNLMDLQLIKVVGRSDLPGRPWMFGTTQKFLEHFGLKNLEDLPATDELRRLENEQQALAQKIAEEDSAQAAKEAAAAAEQLALEGVDYAAPPPSSRQSEDVPEGDEEAVEREERGDDDFNDESSPEEESEQQPN